MSSEQITEILRLSYDDSRIGIIRKTRMQINAYSSLQGCNIHILEIQTSHFASRDNKEGRYLTKY